MELLVWGDSFAMSVLSVLDELCRQQNVRAGAAVRSGRPPLMNYVPEWGMPPEVFFPEVLLDYIRKHRVPKVLLIACWERYHRHNKKNYFACYQNTIEQLLQAGCQVWVLTEPPLFPWNPPKAAAKAAWLGQPVEKLGISSQCYQKFLEVPDRGHGWAASRGVTILDITPWLVQDGFVPVVRDGNVLLHDPIHLNTHGALIVKEAFAPIFKPKN